MKKLINATETVLEESLDGFAAAHADILLLGAERKFVRRCTLKPGKVALISGGGSGHEPLHAGFVGLGMLDAACPGQIFTSPTPDQMIEAAQAVDTGAGVLFIVKNYEGDVMNFTMAAEMAGREVASVVTNDDVAVENSSFTTGRRGVAGTLIVEKIVGAVAETGASLATLKVLGDDVNRRTRSMGVALTPCTVPAAGRPNFMLAEDEMEMGVGIHGEPGRRRVRLAAADAIADELVDAILGDLSLRPGERSVASGQRLRRHTAGRALSDGQQRQADSGRQGNCSDALSHWLLRHVPRHGRRLGHGIGARRQDEGAVGCAGAHGGVALGRVKWRRADGRRRLAASLPCQNGWEP